MDSLSQQRLASVLSTPYSDLEIRNALDVLDSRFQRNSPEARRQLRVNVQGDVIRSNAEIVRQFSQISQQLTRIGTALDSMNNVVSSMRSHVGTASAETVPILDEASHIIAQKDEVQAKEDLLRAFTEHFLVSDEDVIVLTSSAEPVDARFFEVLKKVKRIHADCEVLLASESQRIGLEIMEQMGKHLQAAFQKLYHWIQREFKSLSLENPRINAGIRRALRVLAERPALFQNCLDFFAEARQKIILDSFFTALTGVSPSTAAVPQEPLSTKPIELYAHDPLRYVGDMLAWVHSAAVGEQEALEVLFVSREGENADEKSIMGGIEEGLKNEPWVGDELTQDEGLGWNSTRGLMLLVDKDLETVCKPLRAKIEQVIASHEDSTLNYRISNLILFYRLTFEKVTGPDSLLTATMKSLEESALRQFYRTLDDHVRTVRSDLPPAPPDLSPPQFLLDALHQLGLLMVSYDTSLAPVEAREEDFSAVLAQALDPYLAGCDALARELEPVQSHVFAINCLLAAAATLERFGFTAKRAADVSASIDSHKDALVTHVHAFFGAASGLQPVLAALTDLDDSAPFPFTPVQLADVAHSLNSFLPSASMDARGALHLHRLSSPRLLDDVVQRAADRFVADFARVEAAVVARLAPEMEGGEEEVRVFWPRRADEVRVLLS